MLLEVFLISPTTGLLGLHLISLAQADRQAH